MRDQPQAAAAERFIVISGCSGGGKSTLLSELARRGYGVIEEPGRRIVAEELAGDGEALPWVNLALFAERAVAMTLKDWKRAQPMPGLVFFDRGLVDALTALSHATGQSKLENHGHVRYRHSVFMTPPWPEIFVQDAERRHDLRAAMDEYERLIHAYAALSYEVIVLPKVSVSERANYLLARLGLGD